MAATDPVSGVISAGAALGGDILSQILNAQTYQQQMAAMQTAADAYNIPLPQLQGMVADLLPQSALSQVYANPQLVADQTAALGGLQNIAQSGGMTTQDIVNYNNAQRSAAQSATAQRQAIQNLIARSSPQSQGAISAAMQLGTAGQEGQAAALAGQQEAASAQSRALQALLQSGSLAGNIANQQFGEASTRAQAIDAMNRYNAQAQQQAQLYNLQLPQTEYQDALARANGISGAQNTYAQNLGGVASRVGGQVSNTATGLGLLGGGLIPNQNGGSGSGGSGYDSSGYGSFSSAPAPISALTSSASPSSSALTATNQYSPLQPNQMLQQGDTTDEDSLLQQYLPQGSQTGQ